METKQCTNCKEYKNISEFSYRNKTTKTGIKKVLLPICKECNNLKSRDYYHKNKHKHINYIYRFLNKKEEVLYIGKTETDLRKRISGHFSKGHLPKECYEDISKIQFIASSSSIMMDIKEIYYINLYKPKFNSIYRCDENPIIIKDFQYDRWIDFDADEIKSLKRDELDDAYLFNPNTITSIFYRKRSKNYLVYIEVKMNNNKKKQIRKGTFKNEKDAEEFVNHLKSLYKPLTRFDMT